MCLLKHILEKLELNHNSTQIIVLKCKNFLIPNTQKLKFLVIDLAKFMKLGFELCIISFITQMINCKLKPHNSTFQKKDK